MNKQNIIDKFNEKNIYIIPEEYLKRGWDGILGNSIEEILGIKENNNTSSDLENYEVKTKKNNSNSKITLFNRGNRRKTEKDPYLHWNVPLSYILESFNTGYVDVNINTNKHNLCLEVNSDTIEIIQYPNNKKLYQIYLNDLDNILKTKLKNIILIKSLIDDTKIIVKEL